MIRSQLQTKRFALVAGLASFAALAGNANAQMHDLLNHSGRGAGIVPPSRIGADQAPRDYTSVIAGAACGSGCFEEIRQDPNAINGYFSDVGCDFCGGGSQVFADDVNIGNTTNICDIQFFGGYFAGNSSPADNFTVVIHADGGGIPGATIYTENNPATTRVQTGNILFGVNEWQYTMTLAATVSLAGGGTYWVEIFNNTGLGTDDWFWETGNLDIDYGNNGSAFDFSAPGVNWNYFGGVEMAYLLCGDVAQPPPPPPTNECLAGCDENTDQPADGGNGYFSEQSCALCGGGAQVMMDDFALSVPVEICELQLTGGYFPANIPPANDTFHVWIYNDAGGCANTGSVVYADLPNTSTRVQTGNVLFGVDEWVHTITLTNIGPLPAGTYWLAVYNDTVTSPDDWFWETAGFTGSGATYNGCGFDFSAPPAICNAFGGVNLAERVCTGSGEIGTKYCVANSNSTGAPADISCPQDTPFVQLVAAPVPNQSGIFFYANAQNQIPFGCSFLCATGGTVRGAVIVPTGNVATYDYDGSDAKHTLPSGQTKNFQYWYRDPMNTANCGGQVFNTSNAITIDIP